MFEHSRRARPLAVSVLAIAALSMLGCESSSGPESGFTAIRISAFGMHTCGLASPGAAYCWGRNANGELGAGSSLASYSRTPAAVTGGQLFTDISAGKFHTCGVASGGVVYCWGFNGDGELGDSDTVNVAVPTRVAGAHTFAHTFVSVSAGSTHSCALTSAGAAYCWGSNSAGELGIDSTTGPAFCQGTRFGVTCSLTPLPVAGGHIFTAVSAGERFTCALTAGVGPAAGGPAYCWGLNAGGQLGNGSTGNDSVPTPVSGGLNFTAISAGYQHACGLTIGGAVYCWGVNGYGQVGNASGQNALTPVAVTGGLTFAAVSAGLLHTCALTPLGTAYCWGNNTTGALGNGALTNMSTPTLVSGGLTLSTISAGYQHTAGLAALSGVAYGWGDNQYGEVGDGSLSTKPIPVRVSRP